MFGLFAPALEHLLHDLYLALLGGGDGGCEAPDLRAVRAFEDGPGHGQGGFVVGDHEPLAVGPRGPIVSRGRVGGRRAHRRDLSGWLSDAAGASGAALGGLRTLTVSLDEALEVGVVGALKS